MTKKDRSRLSPGRGRDGKPLEEAVTKLRLEKGLSVEEAYPAFRNANQEDRESMVPRALGKLVRELREKRKDVAGTIESHFLIVCSLRREG